ncbi:solute:Na+ symporter, SSS family [Georgenia satyanarayanai]|uniref:Solute:Na+ symporter, SSS family n=1 Tax=Georgenia satyanarayanai TaxID=860221 RepID=A0A2Y9AE07_9MICO|nr:sodium/solute symporter [Georgenia satyanarayanai]PYF99570.1 SSS family solute:Na+ symporter [Georgenia satyanarayanai]SSA42415.1 solute:Na+ symporter, SSS family [Georgenia satyanarayanai]
MPEFELATIDLVIIGVYVLGIIAIGYWAGRSTTTSGDYFLAGRGMVWPLVGFSLIVTNFSGTQFLGLAGAGYDTGIAVWNYEWMATLVLIVFAVLILPIYLQSKISTVPEFLEKRYDRRSRYAFSGFTVVTGMLIDSAGGMFAGALVLNLLFPNVPLMVHIVIIALLGGVYVILGGLKAVMITDTIQGILLFLAAGVIFVIVFAQFDFNWSVFPELAPGDDFSLARPADDDFLPAPGILTGAVFLGFYVWISNHVVVQRVLAAKNLDHGRWGALFAGLMQLPLLVLLVFPGILARDVFPDLDNPDLAWPSLIFEYLPVGLRGLVVAALIAALMSTLDSVLNGAASLVVNDFVKTRDKEYSEKTLLRLSRVLVGVLMVIAVLWAPVILSFDTLVEYFQSFLGYVTMPFVVVLLGGIFWKRATASAAFWTMVVMTPLGAAGFVSGEMLELHGVHFLYATGIMVVASAAVLTAVSLRQPAPDPAAIAEVTFDRRTWRAESTELREKPWYLNYRWLALGLLVLTVAVVVPFV